MTCPKLCNTGAPVSWSSAYSNRPVSALPERFSESDSCLPFCLSLQLKEVRSSSLHPGARAARGEREWSRAVWSSSSDRSGSPPVSTSLWAAGRSYREEFGLQDHCELFHTTFQSLWMPSRPGARAERDFAMDVYCVYSLSFPFNCKKKARPEQPKVLSWMSVGNVNTGKAHLSWQTK